MFPILPLLFDIRSAVTQPPDAFGTPEKLDVRLKSRRDAERFSPCTAHFTIRRECPATASVPLCPVPADVCPPGRGFARDRLPELPCRAQETPALRPDVHPAVVQFPLAAWRRIFSYQTVDKTLTFHFLRATLELPTGQYWPRGNICLGGSLCRKLKKKR